jgi:hypothetical protein
VVENNQTSRACFFLNRGRNRNAKRHLSQNTCKLDTNINKKKKLMVTKSVLKEKKKQLKRKEKGWVPLPWVQFFQSVIKV